MQLVYYDRHLDLEYSAPRNRGWMNLFRRWSWSQMLSFTWTVTAGTYGARFQSFCEHRLTLDSGEPYFDNDYLRFNVSLSHMNDESDEIEYDKIKAKTNFGLHNYEIYLITEFIDAYKHEYIDMYMICDDIRRLYINEARNKFEFHVFSIKVKTDDPISDEVDKEVELNAGFVITGPRFIKSDKGVYTFKEDILYFRIRPSMRNMDMARKAFIGLSNHEYLKNLLPLNLIRDITPKKKELLKSCERRAYRDIHAMEQEHIDHCDWCTQLLRELPGDDGDDN